MEPSPLLLRPLSVVICIGWWISFIIHIASIIYGKWRLHRKLPSLPDEELPGISILKPLTGIDPNLYHNLETYFTMKYPKYEILFCVQDEIDPVVMVVQSLLSKYPKIDAKLLIGGKKVGINPKVNNIMPGYECAKYGFILISDSGLRMKEDTLLDMALTMRSNEVIGLVHQMPYVCHREGFPSVLESVHFATQHAKYYLGINLLGMNCTTGMSCLFIKEVIDEIGGLAKFGQFLAEDYFLAQAFLDKGYQLRLSSQTAWQNCGFYSVSSFHDRMVRWAKLRMSMKPILIFLEPLSECFSVGLMAAWSVSFMFRWCPIVFLLVHCLLWFLLDYVLMRVINNGPLPFSRVDFLLAWLFRELSVYYLYLRVHCTDEVLWRQKKFHVKWGGQLVEINRKACV